MDDRYEDVEEERIDRSKGGALPDQDIIAATVPCYKLDNGTRTTKHVRCLASHKCDGVYVWPRKRKRLLTHISHCSYLPAHLRASSDSSLGASSPAAKVAAFEQKKRKLDTDVGDSELLAKRSRSSSPPVASGSGTPKVGTSQPKQTSVARWVRAAGKKEIQARLDNCALHFLCENTLPPEVVDSGSWKNLFQEACPIYEPVCASTIRDIQIPEQAAYIRQQQFEYLGTQYYITISFDGGSNRRKQSFYTVHATTIDRRVFLLYADHSPRISHTAEYVYKLIAPVSAGAPMNRLASTQIFPRSYLKLVPIVLLQSFQTTHPTSAQHAI